MNTLLTMAAIFGFEPWQIGLVVPLVGILLGGILAIGGMCLKHREREQWHQTARVAMEKGLPVPAYPADPSEGWQPPAGMSFAEWDAARRQARRHRDLKAGLILLAIGAAFYFGFEEGQFIGMIVGGIGAALLTVVVIDRVISRRR